MVNFFLRLYDMLHQRKALFTGLLLGLIMTLLVMMFSLSYNENIYDFLPLSGNEQKAINISLADNASMRCLRPKMAR